MEGLDASAGEEEASTPDLRSRKVRGAGSCAAPLDEQLLPHFAPFAFQAEWQAASAPLRCALGSLGFRGTPSAPARPLELPTSVPRRHSEGMVATSLAICIARPASPSVGSPRPRS